MLNDCEPQYNTDMELPISLHGWKEPETQYVTDLMQTVTSLYNILNGNGGIWHYC